MGVRLVFDGLCDGCGQAELELVDRICGIGSVQWLVQCRHAEACAGMRARVEELTGVKVEDRDEDGKGGAGRYGRYAGVEGYKTEVSGVLL